MPAKRPLLDRFLEKIHVNPITGCWEWTGSINPDTGYGQIQTGDAKNGFRPNTAHRISWELFKGPIPEGMSIDHLCRVRKCCNFEHLEPVPIAVNIHRGGNTVKTHCKRGHPLLGHNLYVTPTGARQCKMCRQNNMKDFWANNPNYNHEYWARDLEENRRKQREYLAHKRGEL